MNIELYNILTFGDSFYRGTIDQNIYTEITNNMNEIDSKLSLLEEEMYQLCVDIKSKHGHFHLEEFKIILTKEYFTEQEYKIKHSVERAGFVGYILLEKMDKNLSSHSISIYNPLSPVYNSGLYASNQAMRCNERIVMSYGTPMTESSIHLNLLPGEFVVWPNCYEHSIEPQSGQTSRFISVNILH